MESQFKGVPPEYLDMFKAAISVINSAKYFEESLRSQVGKIRMTQKAVQFQEGQAVMIDVPKYILEKGTKVLKDLKQINKVINQVFVNPKGQDDIEVMAFVLGDIFNEISYMSLKDQEEVAQFVRSKTKEYFKVELNKAS
jgi:hypothetical protein